MKFINLLFPMLFFYCFQLDATILIFTFAYNRPDFIEIQYHTLQTFLEDDDYEFIIFNDAQNANMVTNIQNMCTKLGLRCIRIPQEIHSRPYLQRWPGENYNHPSVRNVNVVQYSLNTLGFDNDDIVVLLDSDIFLVKPLCIREYLAGYDLGGQQSSNGSVTYLWHGLAYLDMRTMPNRRTLNFNCGRVNNRPIDAGGHSYYYIQNNSNAKICWSYSYHTGSFRCSACRPDDFIICTHNTQRLKELQFDDDQIWLFQHIHNVEFCQGTTFLHYRGGTNWNRQHPSYHQRKTEALQHYLDLILK